MGKNKMVSQTIALLFLLLHVPSLAYPLWLTGTVFLWISVILGYWSAAGYFVDFYRKAKQLQASRESARTGP
jgi:CDP-diacylglycerol--glycerol-3-phosphate 3-phosphatidyltransferase